MAALLRIEPVRAGRRKAFRTPAVIRSRLSAAPASIAAASASSLLGPKDEPWDDEVGGNPYGAGPARSMKT
jgi:hypothetical protein